MGYVQILNKLGEKNWLKQKKEYHQYKINRFELGLTNEENSMFNNT